MLWAEPSPTPSPISVTVTAPPDQALDNYTKALADYTRDLVIVTALLVAFTIALAVIGWRALQSQGQEIQHTAEQLTLARQTLAVSVQPLLTDVPLQVHERDDGPYAVEFGDGFRQSIIDLGQIVVPRGPEHGAYCSVPLRNVGSGVAFVTSNSISDGTGRASWNGKVSSKVVPVGELTRLTFTVPLDRPELTELRNGLFNGQPPPEVDIGYTDLDRRRFRTKLFLRWTGAVWYVRQVYLYRDDQLEPFATTGPSDP